LHGDEVTGFDASEFSGGNTSKAASQMLLLVALKERSRLAGFLS